MSLAQHSPSLYFFVLYKPSNKDDHVYSGHYVIASSQPPDRCNAAHSCQYNTTSASINYGLLWNKNDFTRDLIKTFIDHFACPPVPPPTRYFPNIQSQNFYTFSWPWVGSAQYSTSTHSCIQHSAQITIQLASSVQTTILAKSKLQLKLCWALIPTLKEPNSS